jgi:hypothetical protein
MSNIVPFDQIQAMACAVAKSKLFGAKTPDEALALMLVAQANGLHPAAAARDYDIIQGRPSKKAEAMLRDFQASGGKVEWHELTDTDASATFSHPQGGTLKVTWDIARAARAGLASKDMWKKWTRNMLRSRVITDGVRSIYPGATGGLMSADEVRDIPPVEKDMGGVVIEEKEIDAELLEQAREKSLRGTVAFQSYWTEVLDKSQRVMLKGELPSLKDAASKADQARTIDQSTGEISDDDLPF